STLVKNPNATSPPPASRIDIRASSEQHINVLSVTPLHGRKECLHTASINSHGLVDMCPQFGVRFQYSCHFISVTGTDCCREHFCWLERACYTFNVLLQPRPTRKAVF